MRTPSPPTSGCYARASPPLPWPAALGPVPPPDGAFTRWTKNPITRKLHNSHTWLPRPPPADQKHIDVLVVGDSYADPHDMAFFCWPDVLARTLGLTALNAARGGSRSDQTVGQLERALAAAAGHGLCTSGSTVLIVHTGGNDALQLLLPLLLLLILDLLRLVAAHVFRVPRPGPAWPRASFIGIIGRRVGAKHARLLRAAHSRGLRRVLARRLPPSSLTPALPIQPPRVRHAAGEHGAHLRGVPPGPTARLRLHARRCATCQHTRAARAWHAHAHLVEPAVRSRLLPPSPRRPYPQRDG